ncbi:hypothetical protein D3C75_623680 [compost metagenome]
MNDGGLGADAAIAGKLGLGVGQQRGIALPGFDPGRDQGGPGGPLRLQGGGRYQAGRQTLHPVHQQDAGLDEVEAALQPLFGGPQHELGAVAHVQVLQPVLPLPRQQPGSSLLHPLHPPGQAAGRVEGAAQHAGAQYAEPLPPAGPILGLAQDLERTVAAG